MQSSTAIFIMNLGGWAFIGLAVLNFADLQMDLFVYHRPFDTTANLANVALAAVGFVASIAADCLKKIDARLGRIENVRSSDKKPN